MLNKVIPLELKCYRRKCMLKKKKMISPETKMLEKTCKQQNCLHQWIETFER